VRQEATVDRLFPASVRFEGQIATTGYVKGCVMPALTRRRAR